MVDLRDVSIGNGSVCFFRAVKAVPPSTRTQGLVTINEAGQPGTPAHYEVTFYISAVLECDGAQTALSFPISGLIAGVTDDAPYREIEAEAARQIAPILRSVADQIEQQVSEFDQKRAREDNRLILLFARPLYPTPLGPQPEIRNDRRCSKPANAD